MINYLLHDPFSVQPITTSLQPIVSFKITNNLKAKMEVEQPPVIIETSKMVKSRVIEELDDNLEGGNPCNGNNLSSFINGIHDGNGHGHVGRSLSVGDSIPEEDEEELDLEELENTAVDINGAGQRKGHRSGSFASTGKLNLSVKWEIWIIFLKPQR